MEETGREKWSVAPLIGCSIHYGRVSAWTRSAPTLHAQYEHYPHNVLLYIGLGRNHPSDLFSRVFGSGGTGTLRIMRGMYLEKQHYFPSLVTFAFIEIMQLDTAFMYSWVVVVFGMAAAAQDSMRS